MKMRLCVLCSRHPRRRSLSRWRRSRAKSVSDLMNHMAGMHAMKRVGQPEEIAAPIVFLASNAGELFFSHDPPDV